MALIPREEGIYELNKMAVKKALRGNGVGHQLIQFVIDYSVNNNFKSEFNLLDIAFMKRATIIDLKKYY